MASVSYQTLWTTIVDNIDGRSRYYRGYFDLILVWACVFFFLSLFLRKIAFFKAINCDFRKRGIGKKSKLGSKVGTICEPALARAR